jgi:hypothetical protein
MLSTSAPDTHPATWIGQNYGRAMADVGWHPDPSGRYEHRWWDGERWTEAVSTAGAAFTDPFGGEPAEPDRTMCERPQLAIDLGAGGLTGNGTWTVGERDGSATLGYVQVQRGKANTSLAVYLVQDAAGHTLLDVRRPSGLQTEVVVADHRGLLVGKAKVRGSNVDVKAPGGPPGAVLTVAGAKVHGLTWSTTGFGGKDPGLPQLRLQVGGTPVGAIDAVADEQGAARWLLLDRDPAMPEPLRTLVVALAPVVSVMKAETDLAHAKARRDQRFR